MGNMRRCKQDEWVMQAFLRWLEKRELPDAIQWKGKKYDVAAPATVEEIERLRELQLKASDGDPEALLALLDAIAPGLAAVERGTLSSIPPEDWTPIREWWERLERMVKAINIGRWTGTQGWPGANEWMESVKLIKEEGVLLLHIDWTKRDRAGMMVCFSLSTETGDSMDLPLRKLFRDEVENWFDSFEVEKLEEEPDTWKELISLEKDLRYGLKLIEAVKGLTAEERLARQQRILNRRREAYLAQREEECGV